MVEHLTRFGLPEPSPHCERIGLTNLPSVFDCRTRRHETQTGKGEIEENPLVFSRIDRKTNEASFVLLLFEDEEGPKAHFSTKDISKKGKNERRP